MQPALLSGHGRMENIYFAEHTFFWRILVFHPHQNGFFLPPKLTFLNIYEDVIHKAFGIGGQFVHCCFAIR